MAKRPSIRLSWERFRTFDNCRLHYYLRYIKKVKRPSNQRNYVVGRAVHNIAEAYVKSGFRDGVVRKSLLDEFENSAKSVTYSRGAKVNAAKKTATAALETEKLYKELNFPNHNIHYESWFNIPIPLRPQHSYYGGYDIYDPVRQAVMDLKTSAPGNTADERQLLFYGVVLKAKEFSVKMIAFLYPLHRNRIQSRMLEEGELDEFEGTMMESLDGMDVEDFSEFENQATPGKYCRFCVYFRTPECYATFNTARVVSRDKNRYEVDLA